jgi:hypothetical protein
MQFLCLVLIEIDSPRLRSMENKSNGRFDQDFDGWKAKHDGSVVVLLMFLEGIADAIKHYVRLQPIHGNKAAQDTTGESIWQTHSQLHASHVRQFWLSDDRAK